MQYIVEYALYTFTFDRREEAMDFAEALALHASPTSPYNSIMKIKADENDRKADRDEIFYYMPKKEADHE